MSAVDRVLWPTWHHRQVLCATHALQFQELKSRQCAQRIPFIAQIHTHYHCTLARLGQHVDEDLICKNVKLSSDLPPEQNMCRISGKCAPTCVSALSCTDGALLMCRWYAIQQGEPPFAQQLGCTYTEVGAVMTTPVRSHCLPYQAVQPVQPTGQLSHSHCVAVPAV